MKRLSKLFLQFRRAGAGDDTRSDGDGLTSASDFHQLTSKRWRGCAGDGETGSADVFRKRIPKGTGSILADGSAGASPPCDACARIDFARLLDWQPGDARPWISLAHTTKATSCDDTTKTVTPCEDDEDTSKVTPCDDEVNGRVNGDESPSDSSSLPSRSSASSSEGPCPWCTFFQAMIGTAAEGDEQQGREDGSIKSKFTPYLRIRLAFERLGGGEKHELGRSVLFEVTTRNRSLPWGYIVKAAAGEGEGKPMIQGRKIAPLLDPALLRSWVSFCREHHRDESLCAAKRGKIPGLKLIDCEEGRIVLEQDLQPPPLQQEAEGPHASTCVEYATLSYVRDSVGDDINYEDEATEDGHLPELPPLIADAIFVTKSLGLRYLWVDRYCIPSKRAAASNTSIASTRRHQIEQLGRIFSQSSLALIMAAGGPGLHSGLPGVSVRREEQLSLRTATDLFTTTLLRPDLEVASSDWASRAWTYQEGLLSRRRLVFTPSQTYFQCGTLHTHESMALPLHLARGLNLGRVFPPADEMAHLPRLRRHIKTFMAKTLSHDEDRLDAFCGVLEQYAVDHLLGLPLFAPRSFSNISVTRTDRLAVALGWMATPAVPNPTTPVDPYYLVDAPPFPSWTWLSWRLQSRDGYASPSFAFHFNLVGDGSPLIDGVSAVPGMHVSIGYAGDTNSVLSWEKDGEAIATRTDPIAFLRVRSYCFTLHSRGHNVLGPNVLGPNVLGRAAADTIDAWMRRCAVTLVRATAEDVPDEGHELVGVLLAGRHWRSADGRAPTATALICGRRNWEAEGDLVRLGVLSIDFEAFVADEEKGFVLGGVDLGGGERGELGVLLREVDIY